jgi:hypothetical protein
MKTFLLMLASAFCGALLFVVAVYGYFQWQYSRIESGSSVRFPPRSEKTVDTAPPIVEEQRFYGTHASTMGRFPQNARETVLAAGPGKLLGSVTSNNKPVRGLRLRLALNGAVMSQWATTGADGNYAVSLPYGKYRVDGYEIDSSTADSVLAGKTDGPRQPPIHRDVIAVEAGKPGKGLDLGYVDPVKKLGPSGEVSLAQPVILSWEPYPGAVAYRLQIIERRERGDYESERRVFVEWRDQPIVPGTSANLAEYKVALKKDHYYTFEVEALGELNRSLSRSPRDFNRMDFRVVE